jgi:glycine/D-amino acid oxidase-like deaminating enzyme/nitrite reductase/ring-hydroxylating ferredoxin subunit
MKRDGALKSLWQEGIEPYLPKNAWNKDETYDMLIVGGGITGLTTALLLQSEGKKCILAEAANLGFGTTGGTTAHLNTIVETTYADVERGFGAENAKLFATSTREAIDLVEGLINRYHIDCDFAYEPGYLLAETDEEMKFLEEIRGSAMRAGVPIEYIDGLQFPTPFNKVCRFELQAQFHPVKYIYGLAKAFEEQGGVILQQCIVQKIESNNDLEANTTLGTIKSQFAMYATHIPPGINLLHFRNAPYRSYAAAFTLKSGTYPGGLIYDLKHPYHYFRTHTINGKEYIIGGGFDHKTAHEKNTNKVFLELEAYMHKYFDIGAIYYKWSSQYFNAADGVPYIGLLPGHDKIYTATGFCGNGITFGSIAGKVICQLITSGDSPYKQLFNPSRIKPIAGFENFVKENADVISKFIGMRFSYEKVKQLAELAPGEAALAEWEGKKLALYKDEQGKIHALDPVCPHARCLVEWNNAERSWDCPCHGSRFGGNGALLTGPATCGLTQVIWEDIEGD